VSLKILFKTSKVSLDFDCHRNLKYWMSSWYFIIFNINQPTYDTKLKNCLKSTFDFSFVISAGNSKVSSTNVWCFHKMKAHFDYVWHENSFRCDENWSMKISRCLQFKGALRNNFSPASDVFPFLISIIFMRKMKS
jgi:hypothetical protein